MKKVETNVCTEWLRQLPKVDLHLHLDGSVKPETVLELAAAEGIRLPADTPEGLLPYMQVDEPCGSLQAYLGKFEFVGRFLHRPEALERVAFEVVEQAAGARVSLYRGAVRPTNLTKEYHILTERFGFTPAEIGKLLLNGLEAGFMDEADKRELRRHFVQALAELNVSR